MKQMIKLYVCGRCGYRSHHRMLCHSCGFMLEDECGKCYSAKGNCVCRLHGAFAGGKRASGSKGRKSSGVAAANKRKRRKPKK